MRNSRSGDANEKLGVNDCVNDVFGTIDLGGCPALSNDYSG